MEYSCSASKLTKVPINHKEGDTTGFGQYTRQTTCVEIRQSKWVAHVVVHGIPVSAIDLESRCDEKC